MTPKQQLVFYTAVNNKINNPHLSLYIRQLRKGQDIQTKQYLSKVPAVTGTRQKAYELLWAFCAVNKLKNKHLLNTLESITLEIDKEGWNELKQELNSQLELLNLPTL